MKIEYQDNLQAGPGYGTLIFTEVMAPDEPWLIAMQRASDHNYLTGSGRWVGEIYYNALTGKANAAGSLQLDLPPEIVDMLDTRETYRISLKGADDNVQSGRLKLDSITHSQKAALDNTASPEAEATPPQEKPIPAQEPAPTPDPTPAPEPAPAQEPAPAPEPEPIAENTAPLTEPLPEPGPVPEPRKPKLLRYLLLLILALAAVGWYFFDQRDKDASETAHPAAASPQEAPQPEKQDKAQASSAEKVAAFFNGNDKTAQKAMSLFEELPKSSPVEQDAAYRLLYYAANAGNQDALLKYGECLDPTMPQWGGIAKDGALAFAAYNEAGEKANAAKENLLKWLEAQSQNGNAQAKAWLGDIR